MQWENGTGYKCGSSHREVFCQSLGSRITCNIQDWAICDIIWLSKNSISDAAGVLDLPGDINYLFVLITVLTFHAYKKYMLLFFFFFLSISVYFFCEKLIKKNFYKLKEVFTSADILFHKFLELHLTISEKNIFIMKGGNLARTDLTIWTHFKAKDNIL